MKVLFTGASSFTGYWFVTKLVEAGHAVAATFTQQDAAAYGNDVRGQRVTRLIDVAQPVFACRFGDDQFIDLIQREKYDLLCHHAADVTNYKSADFDLCRAIANNTNRSAEVLKSLTTSENVSFVLTGSAFEPNEGAGSDGLPAFSPYGLSKALSAEIQSYYARVQNVRMGKFVIPNPFGPWEDPRFTTYLMRTWAAGDRATVRTPAYVRDNIHVSLLAHAYVQFCESMPSSDGFQRLNPSGYIESQREFAERLALEMRSRTGWPCQLDFAEQTEFDEPRVRTNTQPVDGQAAGWSERESWDEFAAYYLNLGLAGKR